VQAPFLGISEEIMLDKKNKEKIIKKFRVHDTDTGSSQVQIAILTEEIKQLTDHLKKHKHDFSSRRGLLKKVGERRKLLKYLQKESAEQFKDLADKLKLKIAQKLEEEEEEEKKKEKKYINPDEAEEIKEDELE
jgi:small subunit ribosomal protein S15